MTHRRCTYSIPAGAVLLIAATGLLAAQGNAPRPGVDWPQFRGIAAAGVAEGFPLPARWDVPRGDGVRWTAPVPGLSHSSPIVWGDIVCVTSAVAAGGEEPLKVGLYGDIESVQDERAVSWEIHCYDTRSGTKRWDAVAHKGVPKVKRHPKATHANATLASDGRVLVAMFGSEGLYAYDFEGRQLWKRDLGVLESSFFQVPSAQWGFASSPVVHDGRVIVQADVLKGSFLAAFDASTGKEIWRTARHDYPTWSTPTVHVANGRAQIIVNGFKHIGGYDLATGKELWRMKGGGDIPIPTPVVHDRLAFITNAHGGGAPVLAVRAEARGDVSLADGASANDAVAWSRMRDGAYIQTPIVYRDLLYVCRDNGVLTVFEPATGRQVYQQRLADGRTGFSASAVAGDGKVYYTSEDGSVFVIAAGRTFQQLAENVLGETAMATPAISAGTIFIRTRTRLVAVGG
jgi:outer membrane protein assembly factor BamB